MLIYRSGGQGVVGSNPIVPTNKINKLLVFKILKTVKNSKNHISVQHSVQQF
jgi:hypothetical protein